MLLRFTLSAAGAMVLASSATAQNVSQAQPITSAVKDAGTYHLATGTWTRGAGAVALAGPDVIYDNTCTSGFYWGVPNAAEALDSGRLPSTNSPDINGFSRTGNGDSYDVNGFTFGYCSFEPTPIQIDLAFYDAYTACGGGIPATPTAGFAIVNLPAGTATGGQGCWIVTFDLENTTVNFTLVADADGVYDNVASTDSFGWSFTTNSNTVMNGGPILTGDPLGVLNASCGVVGDGTTFANANPGLPGSGIGATDQFEAPALGGAGCFFFGGYSTAALNPFSSFYIQLDGAPIGSTPPGTAYCFGDGTGNLCPCANNGGTGEGCANSTGGGATMTGIGSASFSNDTLTFNIAGVNGAKPGLLLRGNNQVNGGNGNPVGSGLICAAGGSQRSDVRVSAADGTVTFDGWDAAGANGFGTVANMGAATNFQYWYRDPQGFPCQPDGNFNFSNAWTVTYQP